MALEARMISTQITLMFADFNGRPRQQYALCYNEHTGSLVSDKGRNIARIDYDNLGNPIRIQFTNGNVTKYVYSAAGEKLKVIYQTAVPNISVAIGSKRELTASQVQYTDSIDYILGGSLTLRNGRIDQYQFEEGYCQAEVSSSTIDKFTFCYYDQDHLGNIRQVTKADGSTKGKVIQIGPPSGTESSISRKTIHKRNGKVIKASDFMILWSPNQALETNNNVILSPETILAHETAHMLRTLTDLQGQIKDENTKNGAGEYDNMEEKRVITTVEQEAALAHGDIKQGEVTRTDHRGTMVSTFPLSANEPLPSIKEEKQEE